MFFYNESYMLIAIAGLILTFVPQMIVKNTFSKFSKVTASRGITGQEAAKAVLRDAGVNDVSIEPTQGTLSDHYDPSKKVIRLSEEIYYGNSIAALGVAAHEAGHAIQDNKGYIPMRLRAGLFPAVQAGQALGPILIMAGIGLRAFMGMGGFTDLIAVAGIALYGSVVLFHFITLPVELDASHRAIRALADGGYIVDTEKHGAQKVLSAAALTYIAVALYALIELLYWVWVLFGRRRD